MGFYQYFSALIFSLCLILNTFTAQADVWYNGPTSVLETQQFSLSCNCSLFANIKWRKIAPIQYFESETYVLIEGRKFSNMTVVSALPSHTGNYKCSYEYDDYGHNITVVVAIKLSITHDSSLCPNGPSSKSSPTIPGSGTVLNDDSTVNCLIAKPYSGNFTFHCKSDTPLPSNLTLTWFKGSSPLVPNERIKIHSPVPGHLVLNLTSVNHEDVAIYHCRALKSNENASIISPERNIAVQLRVLPYVINAHKDVTAIEETQLNLTCVVRSVDPTTVTWHVSTTEGNKTYSNSEGRIILSNANASTNAVLTINTANITLDRGTYVCIARSEIGYSPTNTTFMVRIKSKYAALWPFLGICAEVIILCTIILIYEKKRDKSELEESDTDQGPETKSSPDHGQDNVRYRK